MTYMIDRVKRKRRKKKELFDVSKEPKQFKYVTLVFSLPPMLRLIVDFKSTSQVCLLITVFRP